jgi:hypothetical protein
VQRERALIWHAHVVAKAVSALFTSRGAKSLVEEPFSFLFIETITAVRSISEQIQLVSYLRSSAFGGVVGKRLI